MHLDEWVRRRLRMLLMSHWKRGPTIYRELRAIGRGTEQECLTVASGGGWWRRALRAGRALPPAWFDDLKLRRLVL